MLAPTVVDAQGKVQNQQLHVAGLTLEEAQAAARAFAEGGGAAIRFRGRLLEAPVMRRYRRILEQERHHA
jgi:citrate lyase beta subunit